MMREPWFWRSDTIAAKVVSASLSPAGYLYDLGQQIRWRITRPARANVPVICIGNATLGGVGKTPFAIMLCNSLSEEGLCCAFLTRGYGGSEPGPLRVNADKHTHEQVGDEALLLARHGATWVSRDRIAGAKAAAQEGTDVIIMDDGFQNPTIEKTFSVLLIDAEDPSGNGHVFPAGPLREPVMRAQQRADVTVVIGPEEAGAQSAASRHNAAFAAWLTPPETVPPQKVVAFSGIGRPEKFFTLLRREGFDIANAISFPDHHPFTPANLTALTKSAKRANAALITTQKDHIRLPADMRDRVLTYPVRMMLNQPAAFKALVKSAIDRGGGAA